MLRVKQLSDLQHMSFSVTAVSPLRGQSSVSRTLVDQCTHFSLYTSIHIIHLISSDLMLCDLVPSELSAL